MPPTATRVYPHEVSSRSPHRFDTSTGNAWMLFLASFLALYFELVVIRYLSTEIRVFAYLKNLTLIASFFVYRSKEPGVGVSPHRQPDDRNVFL